MVLGGSLKDGWVVPFEAKFTSTQCCQVVYFQIPLWVKFGRSCNGRCWYFYGCVVYFTAKWYLLWSFGIFCGHLVYFVVVSYILWSFGIFFPFWYVVQSKIWQPCFHTFKVLGLDFLSRNERAEDKSAQNS
jgi:hypothetical protein